MDVPRFNHTGSTKMSRENRQFGLLYLDTADNLANLGLSATDYRVLFALTTQAVHNDAFTYSTILISAVLELAPSQVSRAINRLKGFGVILTVGPSRSRVIINPRYFWYGDRPHRVVWQMALKKEYPQHMYWYAPSDEERDFLREQEAQPPV